MLQSATVQIFTTFANLVVLPSKEFEVKEIQVKKIEVGAVQLFEIVIASQDGEKSALVVFQSAAVEIFATGFADLVNSCASAPEKERHIK